MSTVTSYGLPQWDQQGWTQSLHKMLSFASEQQKQALDFNCDIVCVCVCVCVCVHASLLTAFAYSAYMVTLTVTVICVSVFMLW